VLKFDSLFLVLRVQPLSYGQSVARFFPAFFTQATASFLSHDYALMLVAGCRQDINAAPIQPVGCNAEIAYYDDTATGKALCEKAIPIVRY
jgi:hypothetical protein